MKVKPIAFYLPQYHQIPENDEWWGEGFTEWTNVRKAKPLFKGHRQPQMPHNDIGYYDLADVQTAVKQAELAKRYGVYGFCYYYYWFNGRKLLDTPLNNMLQSREIDLPFCICWANENWTRTWSGMESQVLMPQDHLPEHDERFIRDVLPVLKDRRYIRINDRPVLVIYRTGLFPDMKRTASTWRKIARESGIKDLYLVRVEGLEPAVDLDTIGFDAAIEFAPDWREAVVPDGDNRNVGRQLIKARYGIDRAQPVIRDYELTMHRTINSPIKPYKYFRGAFPQWDNTARKGLRGTAFVGNSPEMFEIFLQRQIAQTLADDRLGEQEKMVFINAWNEWGEGCHLEPDKRNGYAYLEAVSRALRDTRPAPTEAEKALNYQYDENYVRAMMANEGLERLNEQIAVLEKEKAELIDDLHVIIDSRAWKSVEKYRRIAGWAKTKWPKQDS